ncbi:MAG TPA: hypothetical protein V6C81_12980 [Planktothrix sp.]
MKNRLITYFTTKSKTTRIYEVSEPIVPQGAETFTHTSPYMLYPIVENALIGSSIGWLPLKPTPECAGAHIKVNHRIPLGYDQLQDRSQIEPALVNELFCGCGVIAVTTGGTARQPNRYRVCVQIGAAFEFEPFLHDDIVKSLRKIVFGYKPTGLICGDVVADATDEIATAAAVIAVPEPEADVDITRLRLIAQAVKAKAQGEKATREAQELLEQHERQVQSAKNAIERMKNGGLQQAANQGADDYVVLVLNSRRLFHSSYESEVQKGVEYELVMKECAPYGACLGTIGDDEGTMWCIRIPLASASVNSESAQ